MPQANLTAVSVEKLRAPSSGQIEYYDRRLPGFGIRVSYKGTKSWFVMTRLDGRLVRLTLGKYPAMSLGDARERARSATREVAQGNDPRQIKREAAEARRRDRLNTFAACAADFLEKHVRQRLRPSTQREYIRILTGADTRPWVEKPITQITKRDVVDVLEGMDRRGSPGAAKRAAFYLRKFFNWCAERDIIALPPTDRVPPPHPEVKRDRVLTEQELAYVLRAFADHPGPFAAVFRLLLLTGQRRGEVSGMRWSELVGLEGESPLWEIPAARTKNKRTHLVPLAPEARGIVLAQPRISDFVFTVTGDTPMSGFGRAKQRVDERIDVLRAINGLQAVPEWRLHDLRRTMVTLMNEELGIAPHAVEAVVNHQSGIAKAGVAGVYNRALYLKDRRQALSKWEQYLGVLARNDHSVGGRPTSLARVA